jgi:roadblock/LC7 domain-containing protein
MATPTTTLGIEKTRPLFVVENRGKCKKTRCALCTLSSKGTIENHFYSNLPESLSILVQGILTAISIYFTIKCSGFTEFSLYKAIPSGETTICGGLSWKSVVENTTALHGLVHSTHIFCVIV